MKLILYGIRTLDGFSLSLMTSPLWPQSLSSLKSDVDRFERDFTSDFTGISQEHLFVLVWQPDEISAFLDPKLSYNAQGQLVSIQETSRSREAEETLGMSQMRRFNGGLR